MLYFKYKQRGFKMLYKAKVNEDEGIFKGVKMIGNDIPIGYELVETYFVDNSGFGTQGEAALTAEHFLHKVKAGYYYGITKAQQIAIAWQHWQSTQVFSYMDCIKWAIYFEKLAKKFNLVEEFKENAIF